ncbi:MAG: PilN domain-containing protein [Spirochaetia bacterium]|nr:PilN domain-containing protein [Spirochaetia bacterium]
MGELKLIEINLIPQKLKKAKQARAYVMMGMFVAALVAAAMAGFVILQTNKLSDLDREIRKVDAESATLKDKIEEVRKFRAQEEAYSKKRAIVDKLMKDQSFWPMVLDKLGELLLPDMWLLSLEQVREKDEGTEIKITGYAMSKVVVADFIKRLEETSQIMDLKAARLADVTVEGMNVTNYEINFLFKKNK